VPASRSRRGHLQAPRAADHDLACEARPGSTGQLPLFLDPRTIDFDFDPRELQGQEQLNLMMPVVRLLGRRLGKRVLLGIEGCLPSRPAATYDPQSQRVQAL
jgi:hypothetical protein